jgi:hypothetical protein
MTSQELPGPEGLAEADRELIRRAHHRLRKASQELEALLVPVSMRGRWEPVVAPPEVIDTVRSELSAAWREVMRLHRELLGWDASGDDRSSPEQT